MEPEINNPWVSMWRSKWRYRSLFPTLSTTCKIRNQCGIPQVLTHQETVTMPAWRASELDDRTVQNSLNVNVVNPTWGTIWTTSYSKELFGAMFEEDVAMSVSIGGYRLWSWLFWADFSYNWCASFNNVEERSDGEGTYLKQPGGSSGPGMSIRQVLCWKYVWNELLEKNPKWFFWLIHISTFGTYLMGHLALT